MLSILKPLTTLAHESMIQWSYSVALFNRGGDMAA